MNFVPDPSDTPHQQEFILGTLSSMALDDKSKGATQATATRATSTVNYNVFH